MINKDRYHYNPSQPSIRQPSFELYEAIDNLRNLPVYVCIIIVPSTSDVKQRAYRLRELNHLGQLAKSLLHSKHKHLAQVYEVVEQKERLTLVVESCEFGPVSSYLAQAGFIDEQLATQFIRDICVAVSWLHQQNIVHGYLNVDGIEIGADGVARLSPKRLVLHKNHLAPEFKLDSKRTQKGDVFSLGCMFYKLLYGVYPFDGANDTELNRNIKEASFRVGSVIDANFPVQIIVSNTIQRLLIGMLQFEPNKRPTVDEVLRILGPSLMAPPSDEKNKKFPKEVDTDYFIFDTKQRIQHGPYFKELLFTAISRNEQELVRIKVIPLNKEQDETKQIYSFISKLDFFKKPDLQDQKKAHLKDSFVKVLEHFLTSNSLILVMEYYNQGTLADHQLKRKSRGEKIEAATVDQLMLYCTDALQLYQEEVQPYCWLQPHTILINSGKLKLDVPPVQFQPLKQTMLHMLSTQDYLSPEKKSDRPTETSDVWSVAMVKYWLMTGQFPEFDRNGEYKIPRKFNFPPNDNLFFNHTLKHNPLKRRLLGDLYFHCPPIQKIANYYSIPQSAVPAKSVTIESTIDQPLVHSETNEQAELKARSKAQQKHKSTPTEKFPQMSWIEKFFYRKSLKSNLQKRRYFRSISQRTNSNYRAVCKTLCASILLTILFYLYYFIDAGVLLVNRASFKPLTLPIVEYGSVTPVNNYTILTRNPSYFSGLQYTVSQIRDEMNCVRQLYYDPNQGGNALYLDNYFSTLSLVGVLCLGYVLAFLHFFLLSSQYVKMDLSRVMSDVQENPLNINQLVRMILATLGFSCIISFHFLMFGSFYMMPIDPCVAAPRLPASKWAFSGKNNYYLLFIIAYAAAVVAVLFLNLYDTKKRMTGKTLIPVIVLYLVGVGLRAFGGFAANSFGEGWLSLCGVFPEFLQLIVFVLTEITVDVPFWCHMRYSRFRSRNEVRYSEEYSSTDIAPVEEPMYVR